MPKTAIRTDATSLKLHKYKVEKSSQVIQRIYQMCYIKHVTALCKEFGFKCYSGHSSIPQRALFHYLNLIPLINLISVVLRPNAGHGLLILEVF
jgi:hypothetical protein